MTPYDKVLDSFRSKFQSKVILIPELEKQFFITALGDFETDLYSLTYDESTDEIEQSLTRSEINLLGLLMYKAYLTRERDRILKLNNIIGKDIKLTGMGDSKSQMNKTYEQLCYDIESLVNKLKENSFYD